MLRQNRAHGHEYSNLEQWTRLSLRIVSLISLSETQNKKIQTDNLRKMERYSTASTFEAAYFIGGLYTREVIAEYKNDAWRQLGTLTKGRSRHGSITFGTETMVIGGYSSDGR